MGESWGPENDRLRSARDSASRAAGQAGEIFQREAQGGAFSDGSHLA